MTRNTKRIEYIDIAKAVGILLMVLEHAETVNDINYYIIAFHVPIFFFISGFLFKGSDESFWSFVKKKFRSLLVPYIVFGLAHYLFWLYRSDVKTIEPLIALATGRVLGFPIAGSLWFLTALFISEIIYFLIDKYAKNTYLKYVIIIALSIFGCIASKIFPFALHYSFAQGCVGVGLMQLGRILGNSKEFFNKLFSLKWYFWLALAAVTLVLIRCNEEVHMFIGSFGNIPLFWINAILSILIVFKFSIWISKIASDTVVVKYLKHAGRSSIVYLCLNNITINISNRLVGFTGISSGSTLYSVCLIVLMLSLLYLESIIITNTKLKVLVGQKL